MLKVELTAAENGKPGYGRLQIQGWKGAEGALELSIQRNQDQQYLGDQGTWVSAPVWHGLPVQRPEATLYGEVGPWLVDALLLDTQMVYMLSARQGPLEDKGVLRLRGNLMSSQAAGQSLHEEQRIDRGLLATPAPEPVVPPVPIPREDELTAQRDGDDEPHTDSSLAAEPRELPQPAPVPIKRPTRLWLWIGLLLLGLGGLAAGLWWWSQQPTPKPDSGAENATPVSNPSPVPSSSSSEASCTAEALQQNTDDLGFIRHCLDSKPSSQQILTVIEQAKVAQRCNLVQRLYAYKAQSGDAAVALAYAREYDPKTHTATGCIKSADAETAVYWYEQVLVADPNNTSARERLEALKK